VAVAATVVITAAATAAAVGDAAKARVTPSPKDKCPRAAHSSPLYRKAFWRKHRGGTRDCVFFGLYIVPIFLFFGFLEATQHD